ncbi:twin-arginine translocation pathway signal [Ramlibacter henchirensis]|uniref:Twin-arginine translocation pathway signal n=1 Tax=Ramlibacter henchirensis TaxID=204072 RepID=A0A4Z0CB95_9BURK|nr:alpha/beta fold hydrolase [Ramlibacter henchirensis]TFZ07395.1 twin-arginine translocation pathway signal [Ramlibacter henchirensis]
MTTRRHLLCASVAALLLAACAGRPTGPASEFAQIVFVHGNGDSASVWQSTVWRFESNGWPRERLHAIDLPYPLARDDDTRPQPGRTSTAEHMSFLKGEVEKVLKATGARQVVLVGNSRGGYAIRNYIQNGGGASVVSHAILGGTPNHGVWALREFAPHSEFNGTGPFLTALNAPKNAGGDEVAGPVRWMTIRSENNDKFAQPDGLWIGRKGQPTNITFAAPELKGATNVVIPRIDHRETSFSPAAFASTYQFITGRAPATTEITPEQRVVLSGKVSGLGVSSTDPASGNFSNNLPLPGARLEVFSIDEATGERRGAAAHSQVIGTDGRWGPFPANPQARYEFVVSAPGYATTHIYRSPFPRSSTLVNLRPERVPEADRSAPALAILNRPRGYLDPDRDRMSFDGQTPPPGALPGAGASSSRIRPTGAPRPVMAEFNGERLVGRLWPLADNHVSVLELTY